MACSTFTDPLAVSPEERQRRMAAGLALIRTWAADESGYDEEVLLELMERLDESRSDGGCLRLLFDEGAVR